MTKDCADSRNHYKRVNERTENAVHKYFSHLERKVVESKDRSKFFKFISLRSGRIKPVPSLLSDDGRAAITDAEKAELSPNPFNGRSTNI